LPELKTFGLFITALAEISWLAICHIFGLREGKTIWLLVLALWFDGFCFGCCRYTRLRRAVLQLWCVFIFFYGDFVAR